MFFVCCDDGFTSVCVTFDVVLEDLWRRGCVFTGEAVPLVPLVPTLGAGTW